MKHYSGCLAALIFAIAIPIVALIAVFLSADPLAWRRPKDHDLIKIFETHRDVLEKLRSMIVRDSGNLQPSSDVVQYGNIDKSRRAEYSNFLAQLGPTVRVGASGQDIEFEFVHGGTGPLGPDWREGIFYLPDGYQDFVTVKRLDDVSLRGNENSYLVPLQGNWYLVLEQF